MSRLALALAGSILVSSAVSSAAMDQTALRRAVASRDLEALRKEGPDVLSALARLYESSGPAEKADIANLVYRLGWESREVKQALMRDIHTPDQALRISVQYALGRVSSDADVVDALLDNMQNDPSPLFRDKAACALTYDQPHLSPKQQVRLLGGLIKALSDPKPQVRAIAILALRLRTGQDKGFRAAAPLEERQKAVRGWLDWLAEYERNL
jgi:HEAT repeat protein